MHTCLRDKAKIIQNRHNTLKSSDVIIVFLLLRNKLILSNDVICTSYLKEENGESSARRKGDSKGKKEKMKDLLNALVRKFLCERADLYTLFAKYELVFNEK